MIETTATEIVPREPLEFVVNGDFAKQLPQILSNIEEIKQQIIERTEADRNLVLTTEEDFDKARKRCAELNKVVAAIDEKRKEVKKAYVKPYEQFEKALKDTTAVITEAKNNLWGQITAAEDTEKTRKEEQLKAHWEEQTTIEKSYRTWEQIFRKEWLNKSYTVDKACVEIDEIIADINTDIGLIESLNSPFAPALYDKYKAGALIKDVIAYNIMLIDQQKERDKQKALEKLRTPAPETPVEDDPIRTVDFRVTCRKSQLDELKGFLQMHGIKYGKVPKD